MVNVKHTTQIDQSALVSLVNSTISWAQLERGNLDVAFQVIATPPFVISFRSVNLACLVTAKLEQVKTALVMVESHRSAARWWGREMTGEHVALSRRELDLRTTGPSTVFGIAIDENHLQSNYSDSLDAADLFGTLKRDSVSHNPIIAARLRGAVRFICSQGAQHPAISGALIPLLAQTLKSVDRYSVEPTEHSKLRFAAVRACEAYMREHLDERLTLLDLSRYCGMRSRSLMNAFEAITGFSPMDYLKRLRLSAVRRTLLRSDRSSTQVMSVAMDWGFWHMGHFSRDYRAMFGESPSQTLLS